jgi:hypothetical protein
VLMSMRDGNRRRSGPRVYEALFLWNKELFHFSFTWSQQSALSMYIHACMNFC